MRPRCILDEAYIDESPKDCDEPLPTIDLVVIITGRLTASVAIQEPNLGVVLVHYRMPSILM